MSAEAICDGCNRRLAMGHNGRNWIRPIDWIEWRGLGSIKTACSRECVKTIAKKLRKSGEVAPF